MDERHLSRLIGGGFKKKEVGRVRVNEFFDESGGGMWSVSS